MPMAQLRQGGPHLHKTTIPHGSLVSLGQGSGALGDLSPVIVGYPRAAMQ